MTALDVITGQRTWSVEQADNLAWLRSLPTNCCRLTMTSPPYEAQRTYRMGFNLRGQDWVDWMAPRVVEMCRVTDGLVCINMSAPVEDHVASPVIEWLVADLTRRHGIVMGAPSYVFFRFGIPGSGGERRHRRDWEPVYCFAKPESLPLKWSDNTAMGHLPRWVPGGEMSYRHSNGTRMYQTYDEPALANPGNVIRELYDAEEIRQILMGGDPNGEVIQGSAGGDVIRLLVGGGAMGNKLCHETDAPFPERLAEFFIRSYAEEGSIVLEPFCGSGTVPAVAKRWGRKCIACDLRASEIDLTTRRMAEEVSLF